MLISLNTRNYQHQKAYGRDDIIMDANYSQIERSKIDIKSVSNMLRFSYTKEKAVLVEIFDKVKVIENIMTKDFDYKEHSLGVLFTGAVSSSKTVTKKEAALLYPNAFNKLGHFKQFTVKYIL